MIHTYPDSVMPSLARYIENRGIPLPKTGFSIYVNDGELTVHGTTTGQLGRIIYFPFARGVFVAFLRTIDCELYVVTAPKYLRNVAIDKGNYVYFQSGRHHCSREWLLDCVWRKRAAKVLRHVIPRDLVQMVLDHAATVDRHLV